MRLPVSLLLISARSERLDPIMNTQFVRLLLTGFLLSIAWPGSAAETDKPKKILFFSKSSGFEHSAIKREHGQPSFVEKLLAEWATKHQYEFTFSKDGSLFTPNYLEQFDAFFFYTTGDLTTPG